MSKFDDLPLEHLDCMTDSTGLIQHGIYSIPRRESGYTTDDNARALRLCVRLWDQQRDDRMLYRVACYLGFLEHSRSPVRGFHNFMGYQRDWLDSGGTGDCQGQAVLALAEVSGSDLPCGFRDLATELLDEALPALTELRSLRAQAYVIQAWAHLSRAAVADIEPLEKLARLAADRLVDCYSRSHRPDWPWYESRMTYANAVLPHALFDAAERWPDESYLAIAETSFGFLDLVTSADDMFWPIGSNEWYSRGEEKSLYAQQPVEASTMASAALVARQLTGDDRYLTVFKRCHSWFLGNNSLNATLADVQRGACFDGLEASGPNRNQGAESTLAWLWTEMLARGLQPVESTQKKTDSVTAVA
jgi:hypothetical protein